MHVAVEGTDPTLIHFGPPVPPTPLQVTLARHGNTDVEWLASGQAVPVADRTTLAVSLDPSILGSGDCLEVRARDDTGNALEIEEAFFTYGSEGWLCTPDRPEELRRDRVAFFTSPLFAPSATNRAQPFQAVALIEGLLLTQNTRVPGIEIYALKQALGSEQATLSYLSGLTSAMLGFILSTDAHGDRGLPCVALKFSDVRADTVETVLAFVHELAIRMTDILGFNRRARPQVIALAVLDSGEPGSVRCWLDPARSQYTGNLAGGFTAGESTRDLLRQWSHMETDARVSLWLSQINDARAERRWEYRVLRYFNLLEGMAKGSLGTVTDVRDAQGQQLLQSNRKPYTTKQARGAVYMVIAGLCRFRGDLSEDGFCAHTPLWELCQHWTTVRNQVAHAGAWNSNFKVGGTDNVEDFLDVAPLQRQADLESVLAECVRLVVDGVMFRGYLPL